MIAQSENPQRGPDVYSAWVYENGTGKPLLVTGEKETASLLKNGYSDCPARAKSIKLKAKTP